MYISRIKIQNFRSIEDVDITLDKFNVLIGQNNHGKSNFLEAIEWFYNGSGNIEEIKRKSSGGQDLFVEIEFLNIQDGINKMANEKNKSSLQKELGEEDSVRIVRKYNNIEKTTERLVFYPKRGDSGEFGKSVTGFDKTLNDFLPKLQFVKTELNLKDKAKYGSTTEIGQMLSGVVSEVLSSEDKEYKAFIDKFNELFVGDSSKVSLELAKIGRRVEGHLKKQFSDCEEVQFQINSPKFEDLLKNFDINVNDGHKTTASEKGDGMQRALMLAIIQTYADYRRQNENIKDFIFLIDEAELHLHPTAQRSLKLALTELSKEGNQIVITSHSSVLISDEADNQKLFKVKKELNLTDIQEIKASDKKDVIYDLLGGSPADLLLPRNFLLVEGTSDKIFLEKVIQQHYPQEKQIQIVPVWGDIEKIERVYSSLESVFAPLNSSLYQSILVILIDKVSEERFASFQDFLRKYPEIKDNKEMQIFELGVSSLEEYYPIALPEQVGGHNQAVGWKRESNHGLSSHQKHTLAKYVGLGITKEQFENNMPLVFRALRKCWDKAY